MTLQQPRRLGMEHPETAELEVKAVLVEVVSRRQQSLNNLAEIRVFMYLMGLEV